MLTNAFEDEQCEEINDTHVGFNNHSIQEILTYLHESFGKVSPLELENAENTFTTTLDVSEPFSTFIKNFEEAMDLAEAAGCPYTLTHIKIPKFTRRRYQRI